MIKKIVVLFSVWLACTAVCIADDEIFVPTNPPAMHPIANHDTPAQLAAKWFMRGANLGNYLEVPPGQNWAVTITANDFTEIRAQGFDHVRVPVGWQHYTGPGPDYQIAPGIFSRVDYAVTNALNNDLAVIINIHGFADLDRDPTNTASEFLALWRQIAAHYQDFSKKLAFELDNEPNQNATTSVMNPLYAQAIAEIRQTNPDRTIFVEPGKWGNIGELKNLVLPTDDNVIVSVHCYDPFLFTHQGATWAGPGPQVTGIQFPGPPAKPIVPDPSLKLPTWATDWINKYNTVSGSQNPSGPIAFTAELKYARAWSDYYGRPIHLGEFGSFTTADDQSRANFYSAVRRVCDQEKIGWAIWDWNAGFRYWNEKVNQPMPGLHQALFGKE